jgi:hypothetical protein
MNLVQILGHNADHQHEIKNALSFKQEFVNQLVDICISIRSGFLTCSPFLSDSSEIVYINDETLLIKSFDPKRIQSWNDFEYILSVIIENRILKVYLGNLVE